MKICVKVTYRISEAYVEKNLEHISTFLEDFKSLDQDRFSYEIFRKEDRSTFIHLSQYKDAEIQQKLLNMSSFLRFQQERDKHLMGEPEIELLHKLGDASQ